MRSLVAAEPGGTGEVKRPYGLAGGGFAFEAGGEELLKNPAVGFGPVGQSGNKLRSGRSRNGYARSQNMLNPQDFRLPIKIRDKITHRIKVAGTA